MRINARSVLIASLTIALLAASVWLFGDARGPATQSAPNAGWKRFQRQLDEKLQRMTHQKDAAGSLLHEDQELAFFPLSEAASGCVTSACAGSGCPLSGCAGSGCGGSACIGSGCGGSGCVSSGCLGSGCLSSGCLGSGCLSSGCLGTACLNCDAGNRSRKAPGRTVGEVKSLEGDTHALAPAQIVGLNAVRLQGDLTIHWAVAGRAVASYRLYRGAAADRSGAATLVAEGPAETDRLVQVRDPASTDQPQVYWLEITDTSGRLVRASLNVPG